MEEIFDNAQLISNISPKAEVIAKLINQRNWAIGIGITLIAVIGITYYIRIQDEKRKLLSKISRENS